MMHAVVIIYELNKKCIKYLKMEENALGLEIKLNGANGRRHLKGKQ